LIVLESVGTQHLGLYGTSSPRCEARGRSKNALVFDNRLLLRRHDRQLAVTILLSEFPADHVEADDDRATDFPGTSLAQVLGPRAIARCT